MFRSVAVAAPTIIPYLPTYLATGVAVDDGLCDGEGLIEVDEGLQLPLLLVDSDVELLDTYSVVVVVVVIERGDDDVDDGMMMLMI